MVALFFMSWALASVIFLIPYYLQGILCLTAETAGIWILEITDAFIKSLHAVFTTAIPIVTISLIIATLFVRRTEHLRNTRLANKNS